MTLNKEDVVIFWDYETTNLTSAASSVSTYELVKNLRAAVKPYGPVKAFRAYADYTQLPQGSHGRIELSSSGVTLVDCPSEGRKDVQAKIMITDMFIHAWDHSPPHTFVVITADRDLAYSIALLRTRECRVVIICPSTTHPSLAAQASAGLDWTRVVLGIHGDTVDGGDFFGPDLEAKHRPTSGGESGETHSDAGAGQGAYQAPSSWKTGRNVNDYSQEPETRPREDTPAENPRRPMPPRPRRNSTFSTPFESQKFSVFGEFGSGFTAPRPTRGPLGPLNEGPLFPRPRSRTTELSRADSAPPNIRQGSFPTPTIPSFAPAQPESLSKIADWSSSVKGKAKDLQPFEDFTKDDVLLEEILEAPQAMPAPILTDGSESAKGKDKPSPAAVSTPPLPGAREIPSSRSSSFSSRSSTSSLQTEFSLVAPMEPTTAPTSAQTAGSTKTDTTLKAATGLGISGFNIDGGASAKEILAQDDFELLFQDTASQTEPLAARSPPIEELVDVAVEDEERDQVVFSAPSPTRIPSPLSQAPATISTNSTPLAKSVAVASPSPSAAGNLPSNTGVPKPQATVAVPSPAVPNKPKGGAAKAAVAAKPPTNATAGSSTSAAPPASAPVPLSAIPPKFQPLVAILRQEQHGQRKNGVDKGHLGTILPKKFPSVYQQAKCSKFKTYIGLAVQAGIVSEVVNGFGEQCVSLKPAYRA